jgi:hypothetical protein
VREFTKLLHSKGLQKSTQKWNFWYSKLCSIWQPWSSAFRSFLLFNRFFPPWQWPPPPAEENRVVHLSATEARFYDFLNIFAKKSAKKLRFWLKTKLNSEKIDHNIGFWEKRHFFPWKSAKIFENWRKSPNNVIITPTPGGPNRFVEAFRNQHLCLERLEQVGPKGG